MAASNELIPFRIVWNAFGYVWAERNEFLKMGTLPIVVLSILSTVLWILYPPQPLSEISETMTQQEVTELMLDQAFSGGAIWELIASTVLYVMFAVAWHRFFLIKEEETTVAKALSWDSNKSYFLFAFIAVSVIAGIATFPVYLVMQFVATATPGTIGAGLMFGSIMAVIFYVMGRLSAIFPACAVGLRIGLRGAWRLTAGSGWRMAMILMFPYIPTFILSIIVGSVLGTVLQSIGLGDAATGKIILALGGQAVTYFGLAAGVSALSKAYIELTDDRTDL